MPARPKTAKRLPLIPFKQRRHQIRLSTLLCRGSLSQSSCAARTLIIFGVICGVPTSHQAWPLGRSSPRMGPPSSRSHRYLLGRFGALGTLRPVRPDWPRFPTAAPIAAAWASKSTAKGLRQSLAQSDSRLLKLSLPVLFCSLLMTANPPLSSTSRIMSFFWVRTRNRCPSSASGTSRRHRTLITSGIRLALFRLGNACAPGPRDLIPHAGEAEFHVHRADVQRAPVGRDLGGQTAGSGHDPVAWAHIGRSPRQSPVHRSSGGCHRFDVFGHIGIPFLPLGLGRLGPPSSGWRLVVIWLGSRAAAEVLASPTTGSDICLHRIMARGVDRDESAHPWQRRSS